MKKLFVDCDVALDFILRREPFYESAAEIFLLFQNKEYEGFLSSLTFSHIHYFLKKTLPQSLVIQALKKLRRIIKTSAVDSKVIDKSLESNFNDFEDAIQYYSALDSQVDFIITRNSKDYKHSKLIVYNPEEFLKKYS